MSKLVKNGSILFVEEFLIKLLGFLTTAIITRTLSPEHFGEIVTGLALLSNLMLLADCGLRTVAIIETAKPVDQRKFSPAELFSVRIITHVAVALAAVLIILPLNLPHSLKIIYMIYSSALLCEGLLTDWYFRGCRNYLPSALARTGTVAVYLAATAVIAVTYRSNISIAAAFVTISTFFSLLLFLISKLRFEIPSAELMRKVLTASLPVGVGKFLQQLPLYLPPLIITAFSSASDTALFGIAFKIIALSMIADRILNALFLSELPKRWHEDRVQTEIKVRQLFRALLTFSAIVMVIFAFWGGAMMEFLFSGPYAEATPILKALTFFYTFTLLNSIVSHSIIAIKSSNSYVKAAIRASLTTLPLIPILTYFFGGVGAAVAISLAETATFIFSEKTIRQLIRIPRGATAAFIITEILLLTAPNATLQSVYLVILSVLIIYNTFKMIKEN